MKKIRNTTAAVLRLLLGAMFVFSASVKLIDPVGTQIKLEEYFSADVLNLPFLMPYALEIGILMIVLEMFTGWALLVRFRPRFTYGLTAALLVFFLFLTGYSYFTGTVTDCGCFGDAIKLTPGQTFAKNILFLTVLLALWRLDRPAVDTKPRPKAYFLAAIVLAAVGFALWTVGHLPLIDFRPYKVGANIRRGMEIPPGAKPYVFDDIWYYRVNGKVRAYRTADNPWDIPGAEFVKRETRVVQKGYDPPIHDFDIENGERNITDSILDARDIYLILMPFPERLHPSDSLLLTEAARWFGRHQRAFVPVAADRLPWLERWAAGHGLEIYSCDPTALKTMIRTPLGVMHLQKATIVEKQTLRDFLRTHRRD